MKIKLGQKVADSITGFTGIVTGLCEYITGCRQALVQSPIKKDGDFYEPRWFDEDRLTLVGETIFRLPSNAAPGFDAPAPRK